MTDDSGVDDSDFDVDIDDIADPDRLGVTSGPFKQDRVWERWRITLIETSGRILNRLLTNLYWFVVLPVAFAIFMIFLGIGFEYLTPWGWLDDTQIMALRNFLIGIRDQAAGPIASGAISLLVGQRIFRAVRRINNDDEGL